MKKEKNDHSAGLIGQAIPDMAGTEPRLGSGVLEWKQAALILGEHLSPSGPTGYYDFTPDQWLAWARDEFEALRATATSIADIATDAREALRVLSLAAQTTGGTAGPDTGLMAAIQQAEIALVGSHGNQSLSEASGSAQSEAQK